MKITKKEKVYNCPNCGEKEVKYTVVEDADEVTITIHKCTSCNYQAHLGDL